MWNGPQGAKSSRSVGEIRNGPDGNTRETTERATNLLLAQEANGTHRRVVSLWNAKTCAGLGTNVQTCHKFLTKFVTQARYPLGTLLQSSCNTDGKKYCILTHAATVL